MTVTKKTKGSFRLLIILIFICRLFFTGFFLYKTNYAPFYIFVINPIFALLFYQSYKNNIQDNQRHYLSFFLILDISFPYFIFLSSIIFKVLYNYSKTNLNTEKASIYSNLKDDDEFKNYLKRRKLKQNVKTTSKNTFIFQRLQIEPFIDTLHGNDVEKKLEVIDKLSQTVTPESIKLLNLALDDLDYEVKYFANNILEKIEKEIMNNISFLSEQIKDHSTNYKLYNERSYHYLNLNFLNLVDKKSRDQFYKLALYDNIYSLQLKVDQDNIKFKIFSIFFKSKRYSQMLILLNGFNVENNQYLEKLLFYKAEASFYIKDFKNVINICSRIKKNNNIHLKKNKLITKTLQQWTNVD